MSFLASPEFQLPGNSSRTLKLSNVLLQMAAHWHQMAVDAHVRKTITRCTHLGTGHLISNVPGLIAFAYLVADRSFQNASFNLRLQHHVLRSSRTVLPCSLSLLKAGSLPCLAKVSPLGVINNQLTSSAKLCMLDHLVRLGPEQGNPSLPATRQAKSLQNGSRMVGEPLCNSVSPKANWAVPMPMLSFNLRNSKLH
jgi:hypothetical protein